MIYEKPAPKWRAFDYITFIGKKGRRNKRREKIMYEIIHFTKTREINELYIQKGSFAIVYHACGKSKILTITNGKEEKDGSIIIYYRRTHNKWKKDWIYPDEISSVHIAELVQHVNAVNARRSKYPEYQRSKEAEEKKEYLRQREKIKKEVEEKERKIEHFVSTRSEYTHGDKQTYNIFYNAVDKAAYHAYIFDEGKWNISDVIFALEVTICNANNDFSIIERAKSLIQELKKETIHYR